MSQTYTIIPDAANPNNVRITSKGDKHVAKVYGYTPEEARLKAQRIVDALHAADPDIKTVAIHDPDNGPLVEWAIGRVEEWAFAHPKGALFTVKADGTRDALHIDIVLGEVITRG